MIEGSLPFAVLVLFSPCSTAYAVFTGHDFRHYIHFESGRSLGLFCICCLKLIDWALIFVHPHLPSTSGHRHRDTRRGNCYQFAKLPSIASARPSLSPFQLGPLPMHMGRRPGVRCYSGAGYSRVSTEREVDKNITAGGSGEPFICVQRSFLAEIRID